MNSSLWNNYKISHLWHKHQAERDSAAENNNQGYDAELYVRLVASQEGHSGTDDAHDSHIVHAHPDVFAVVQSRDADVPRLPGQETTEQLQRYGTECERLSDHLRCEHCSHF